MMDDRINPTTFSNQPPAYPTLAFIDRARGDLQPRFHDDPHADRLEQSARTLTRQYWSDFVWVTGTVPAAAFLHVTNALNQERQALSDQARTRQIDSAA